MRYKIEYRKRALKFIMKQSEGNQRRIFSAVNALPFHGDIKKLSSVAEQYRLRVGDFRIIYTVDHGNLIIEVVDANNRGDIYK